MTKRILVADDEQVLQMLIEDTLSDEGYDVTVVENGKRAKDMILDDSHHFDLVIVDYMMPELTGMDVIIAVKQTLPTPPRFLMLTARSLDSDASAYLEEGADGFMSKPFKPSDLVEKVAKLI